MNAFGNIKDSVKQNIEDILIIIVAGDMRGQGSIPWWGSKLPYLQPSHFEHTGSCQNVENLLAMPLV